MLFSSYVNRKTIERYEYTIVFLIVLVFFVLNMFVGVRLPVVWTDEVMYTDPAVNAYMGEGFRSTAWHAQSKDTLWASYPPFYSIVLWGWMKIWGLSALVVRSFGYMLGSVLAFCVWRSARKTHCVVSPWLRCVMVLVFFNGYGMSYAIRSARPDIFSACIAFCVAEVLCSSKKQTFGLLFFLGFVAALTQLQLLLYLVLCGSFACLFFITHKRKHFAVLCAGMCVGMAALLGYYASEGVLSVFIASVGGNTVAFRKSIHIQSIFLALAVDPSMFFIYASFAFMIFEKILHRSFLEPETLYGMVVSVGVPPALAAVGIYHPSYSWMHWIPALYALMVYFDRSVERSFFKYGVFLFTSFAALGYPGRLMLLANHWSERDSSCVERLVQSNVFKGDVVFTDYTAYYFVRMKTTEVYSMNSLISEDTKKMLTALVIDPRSLPSLQAWVGGRWKESSSADLSLCAKTPLSILPKIIEDYYAPPPELKVFRRVHTE